MAITISIPLVVLVLDEFSTVCGLANAVIMAANANKRKTNNSGFSFGKKLSVENPFIVEIFSYAVSSFLLKKYQSAAMGSNNSSQKN